MRGAGNNLPCNWDYGLGDLLVGAGWAVVNVEGGVDRFLGVHGPSVGRCSCLGWKLGSWHKLEPEEWRT